MYFGVFFLFYAAAVVGVLIASRRVAVRPLIKPVAIAGLLAVGLAVPLARPYLAAQSMKGDRDTYAVRYYSAEFTDFARANSRMATHTGWTLPDVRPERALFPGLTPVALSALALAPPLGTLRLAYTGGLLLAVDLTRGLNGVLYPYLYDWFPPIRGMRVPARFSVILAISLVVLAGFGVKRLLNQARSRAVRAVMFAVLVAGVLIDLRPRLELMAVWPEPPPIYAPLAGRTDVVLAEFPFEQHRPLVTNEIPFLYFSIWHWQPMINGYSGFIPSGHERLIGDVRGFPDARAIDALRARNVTHVTLNCALAGNDCEPVLSRADASPALRRLAGADWQGQPVRLYELVK
jgi:hypothetical protein